MLTLKKKWESFYPNIIFRESENLERSEYKKSPRYSVWSSGVILI